MTDQLKIELVGADALLAQIDAAVAKLERPRELMVAIGAELETAVNLRFEAKRDAAGNAWTPLSPSTVKRYASKYKEGGIPGSLLYRTGMMRSTLAANPSDNSVEVGFSTPYSIYHTTGTRYMPRRDALFGLVNTEGTQGELGAQDAQDVLDVVENFMRDALGD